jgi:hypothetical protein
MAATHMTRKAAAVRLPQPAPLVPPPAPAPSAAPPPPQSGLFSDKIALIIWVVGFGIMLTLMLIDTILGFLRPLWGG